MRPEAQLFFHVLGAMTLFGATAAVAVLGLAARNRTEPLPLARAAFRTLLVLALPAWVVTLAFGTWTQSKADWRDDLTWIELGLHIADGGLVLLLVATGISYWWTRNPARGWPATAVGALASIYLVALAVAWWVMTAKVPS